MRLIGCRLIFVVLAGLIFQAIPASAAVDLGNYTVAQLLQPCEEGDNDARWGATKETECEQYVNGFTGAYLLLTNGGKKHNVCLPAAGNRPDEVRWAFTKWAYEKFDRRNMPAAEGLMEVMKTVFPCR